MKLYTLSPVVELVFAIVAIGEEQIAETANMDAGQTMCYRVCHLKPYQPDAKYAEDGKKIVYTFFGVKDDEDNYLPQADQLFMEACAANENSMLGKLIKREVCTAYFSTPHYVVGVDGKNLPVRRMQRDGVTPMVVSARVLLRQPGSSTSFDQLVGRHIRSVIAQEAVGGGFQQTVTVTADGKYLLADGSDSETVVDQTSPDAIPDFK